MTLPVVGGAGYLGGAVIAARLRAGRSIAAFGTLGRGHRETIPAGVPLEIGDIGDAGGLS